MIRNCETPAQAKKLGKSITIRKDWKEVNLGIMEELLYQKFTNPYLKKKLLETGSRLLIEGNNWGDEFWGCVWNEKMKRWNGKNNLGKLLMKVRERLKNEK